MNKLSLSVLMIIGVSCYEAKGMETFEEIDRIHEKIKKLHPGENADYYIARDEQKERLKLREKQFKPLPQHKPQGGMLGAMRKIVREEFQEASRQGKQEVKSPPQRKPVPKTVENLAFKKQLEKLKTERKDYNNACNTYFNGKIQDASTCNIYDDVVVPTRWVKDTEPEPYKEVLKGTYDYFFDEEPHVRQRFLYDTKQTCSPNPIIYIVTHGTFGDDTRSYFESSEPIGKESHIKADKNFALLKRQVANYAIRKKKPLELLSMKWTGRNEPDDRRDTARTIVKLISYLRNVQYTNEIETVLLGHSHGATIGNLVTNYLTQPEKPIDLLIHFACPIRKETEYRPNPAKYKKLMYFFTKADYVARAARTEETIARGILGVSGAASNLLSGVLVFIGIVAPVTFPAAIPAAMGLAGYGVSTVGLAMPLAKALDDDTAEYYDMPNSFGFETKINGQIPAYDSIINPMTSHSKIIEAVSCLDTAYEQILDKKYENKNNLFTFNAHT